MKHLIIVLTSILFGCMAIQAQITGRIIDSNTKIPLEYATVALYSQVNNTLITGVVTDTNGFFLIENVKAGNYLLKASFIGYNTQTINPIHIKKENTFFPLNNISLTIGENQLKDVVITTKRATVINKIDKQIYNAKAFQNTQGGSATDVIKNLPSISVNGLGEISLRGSNGFVLLLNNKPIQGNTTIFLNQLPANTIERVEVITAPSAKYDPEGKAGILNIITKQGSSNGSFSQININAGIPSIEDYDNSENIHRYGFDGTYNIRNHIWNISVGANYQRRDISGKREGDVSTLVNNVFTSFPSEGERSFDEKNLSGRFTIDFTPNTNNEFSASFYAGKREKARTANILYNNKAFAIGDANNKIFELTYFNENLRIRKGDFVLGSFNYRHTFNNKSKLASSLLYEYTLLGGPTTNRNLNFPDTNSLIQDEFNTNNNPLNGFRAQLDYTLKPFNVGTLETGYQYRTLNNRGDFFYGRRNSINTNFTRVDLFSSNVDLIRTIHSGYTQLTGKQNQWEYAAGLRLEILNRWLTLADKANLFKETLKYSYEKLFPSASIQYRFNNKTSVKLAYSKRVNRPSAFQLNPFREREHSETLEQGDKNLLPEFIDLTELGFTKKIKRGNTLFATAYYSYVNNLVNRVNQIYTGPPIDPNDSRFNNTVLDRIYSNVGTGRSAGLELGAQIKPNKKWDNFIGFNIYNFELSGTYNGKTINNNTTQYTINANSTYNTSSTSALQFTLNYLSKKRTAQGEDSKFYAPNLSFKKRFLNNRLASTLQWKNIDMGLLNTNEQRITTSEAGSFFTTTNYIYEVDVITLNLTYYFNNTKNKATFIDSEFGKKEF